MTWYDMLSLDPSASTAEIEIAYATEISLVAVDPLTGERDVDITKQEWLRYGLDEARRVLADPVLRAAYDATLLADDGATAGERSGLVRARGFIHPVARPIVRPSVAPFGPLAAAMDAISRWMAPRSSRRRRITLPDLRGDPFRRGRDKLEQIGLHAGSLLVTTRPAPVEGLVIGAIPPAGSVLRPAQVVTLVLWHPSEPPR